MVQKSLRLLLLAPLLLGFTLISEAQTIRPKIVNGAQIQNPNSFFVALVRTPSGACSGSLISSNTILTAAHCATKFKGKALKPSLLSATLGGITHSISKVAVHPKFNRQIQTGAADLAVLTLGAPSSVVPIPVVIGQPKLVPNIAIDILGYGLDQNGVGSILRIGRTSIYTVTKQTFTTIFDSPLKSSGCSGDSGGPAVGIARGPDGKSFPLGLIGVTSGGIGAGCGPGTIGVYTNVQAPANKGFIKKQSPKTSFL